MFTTNCIKRTDGRMFKQIAGGWHACEITMMGAIEYFHRTVEIVDESRIGPHEAVQITTQGYIGD